MKHHMMIGTWTKPGAIFTVAFDDESLILEVVKKTEIPKDEPISWLALDHAHKNIYGAGMKKWGSYAINSPIDIEHKASHPIGGHPRANDADTKTRAIFCLSSRRPPYAVYANPFYDHAGSINVFSVDSTGAIDVNIQNAPLDENSAIHGMAFDEEEEYLYSADMWANKIWVHRRDPTTGQLTHVANVPSEHPDDHPRWLCLSPSQTHLFVLTESTNLLRTYALDPTTRIPTYTGTSHPLLPPDFNTTIHPRQFRADVVFPSASGRTLFATTRSNAPGKLTGYISAFALDATRSNISSQLLLQPTTTSGGHSNAVAPAPWSDEWVAITDDDVGGVEVWRWAGGVLGRVARCELGEGVEGVGGRKGHGGAGMNAAWFD